MTSVILCAIFARSAFVAFVTRQSRSAENKALSGGSKPYVGKTSKKDMDRRYLPISITDSRLPLSLTKLSLTLNFDMAYVDNGYRDNGRQLNRFPKLPKGHQALVARA